MHVFDRKFLMTRVIKKEWSPRELLHTFVVSAKNAGATMVLLGELLEIRKQAVAQWLKPVLDPAPHVERHALDHLLRLMNIGKENEPFSLSEHFSALRKSMEKAQSGENVVNAFDSFENKKEDFVTIQIWSSDDLSLDVRNLAKQNFGCKKNFYRWAIDQFVDKKPYESGSFIFKQSRILKKNSKSSSVLYVQIPKNLSEKYREVSEVLEIAYNSFLLAAIQYSIDILKAKKIEV